jgi:hypothetical protein
VTRDHDPQRDDFQDEGYRLEDGLKSCRKLIANYRAMLTDSSNDNPKDESADIEPRMA